MTGVLERYLARNGGELEWAALVAMVNDEFRQLLGSGDLLIGPSHFMRPGLDEPAMSRVWRYNIEPLVDDLFYGDPASIARFHWSAVLSRHRRGPGAVDGVLEDAPGGGSADPGESLGTDDPGWSE
jgi:5-methylcytosine-specific restriction protein B